MPLSCVDIWWGSPASAQAYRPDVLSPDDRARAARRTAIKAKTDWEVSRALIQAASQQPNPAGPCAMPAAPRSTSTSAPGLSHRDGHALYAAGRSLQQLGADLEVMRARNVMALAEWCCTPAETAALAVLSEIPRLRLFYTLWTLKEAFIKAAGLSFPADLRASGLHEMGAGLGRGADAVSCGMAGAAELGAGGAVYRLRAPTPGLWRAVTYGLDDRWVASIVWLRPPGDTPAIDAATSPACRWRAGPHACLPKIEQWGDWQSECIGRP